MAAAGESVTVNDKKTSNRLSLQERFGKILSISTKHEEVRIPGIARGAGSGNTPKTPATAPAAGAGRIDRDSRTFAQSASNSRNLRNIRHVDNFEQMYTLGKEVMPSTHRHMKVNFATRRSDGVECVIKLRLKPRCFRSEEDEKQWRRSTEYLLNMPDSAGIAKLYEVLEDEKAFYIIMEKVNGMDLFETLETENVTVDAAREIIRQLLSAMAHLHAHNAVHKDLKLENVMLDATPKIKRGNSNSGISPTSVKVIDFDTLDKWSPATPVAKDVVGTDQYIAQEAYAGKYSPLSDMFAVGVISYRLLTGRFPFHDNIFDDEAGENWVGSPKMNMIRRRLKSAKIDYGRTVFREQPLAMDLVQRMLAYNEHARPTAAAALEHPWFHQEELSPGKKNSYDSLRVKTMLAARNQREDLFDDGIVVAEEAIVGEDRRQALQRG